MLWSAVCISFAATLTGAAIIAAVVGILHILNWYIEDLKEAWSGHRIISYFSTIRGLVMLSGIITVCLFVAACLGDLWRAVL